jgi:hypothetical protein
MGYFGEAFAYQIEETASTDSILDIELYPVDDTRMGVLVPFSQRVISIFGRQHLQLDCVTNEGLKISS